MKDARNSWIFSRIHRSMLGSALYVFCVCGAIGVLMDADHLIPLYARETHLLCVILFLILLGCACAFAFRYIYKLVLK